MLVLGDVLAIAAGFLGLALTSWATVLAIGLLFTDKAGRARESLEQGPWRIGGIGVIVVLTLGLLAIVLLGQPLPLVKLLGWVLLGWLLAIAFVGVAGVATLVSERITRLAPETAPFTALSRGAAVLVGGSLLPLAGWFVFAPALLIIGLGAGWKAVVGRASAEVRA
jgi:predicted ferric reductase